MSTNSSFIKPRKEFKQSRSQDTCSMILEVAAVLISRHGLDAASANRIAERAGVPIGSLYKSFPGCEAIRARLIRAMRRCMQDELKTAGATGYTQLSSEAMEGLVSAV